MRDRRHRTNLVVRRISECEWDGAHKGAVAVVPFTRKPVSSMKRLCGGVADIEETVARVRAIAVPRYELISDVAYVDASKLSVAVANSKRHRRVVAPSANGLVMGSVSIHVGAFERVAGLELVRNAKSIAHGLTVNAIAKRRFCTKGLQGLTSPSWRSFDF